VWSECLPRPGVRRPDVYSGIVFRRPTVCLPLEPTPPACRKSAMASADKPRLAVIVPCYNEEEVLPQTTARLHDVVVRLIEAGKIDRSSFICFVDDGSNDRTWSIIEEMRWTVPTVCGLRLSRNHGHQNALIAGLF